MKIESIPDAASFPFSYDGKKENGESIKKTYFLLEKQAALLYDENR
jgi:hypothetical protein